MGVYVMDGWADGWMDGLMGGFTYLLAGYPASLGFPIMHQLRAICGYS